MERSISRPDDEKTLTFPLFRYYHIKVKAMNVHSKILFPDREGSSPAEKLPEVQAESKFPREPHTGRMEDLVGYDVSSLVT